MAIQFAHLNGYDWEPPQADDPDGAETYEVVIGAAQSIIPVPALAAWVEDRLVSAPPPLPKNLTDSGSLVIYPAEYVGEFPYENHAIHVGNLTIRDVHGYNPASVYVRRISGKTDAVTVAEIIISVVGDQYAQEELDAENAEAERYPLGPKEFWRARMVGNYLYGTDRHPMTDEEFEQEWDEEVADDDTGHNLSDSESRPGGLSVAIGWIEGIHSGAPVERLWEPLDDNLRLCVAQAYVLNSDGMPDAERAAAIAERKSMHPEFQNMMEQTVANWREVYSTLANGVAYLANPEPVGPDLEYLALLEPLYAGAIDQPTPAHSFIVRRVDGEWLIAATARRLPVPGWPPSEQVIPGLRADGN
jgi:hypothetical protein